MANPNPPLLKIAIAIIFSYAVNGGDAKQTQQFHNIKVSSLLPDSVCHSSSQGKLSWSSLQVVHKYGPCHKSKRTESPSISQILKQDELRVKSINSRIASASAGGTFGSSKSVTFPAESGSLYHTGAYIVTIGLGTPKQDLPLIFDTGSDLTWTKCDSSLSSTYSNISCNTPSCNQLKSATSVSPRCSGTTCIYGIQYGDGSFSIGYFATDILTLSPTEVIEEFYFGCGQDNEGGFGETSGLMGLGTDKLSIVSQASAKYGEFFSYCLPSQSSETGYLTLGKSDISNNVQYTPLSDPRGTTFYFFDILEIYVDGQKLPISPTVFSAPGSIIDSGTTITHLPPAAYTALRDTFRQKMSKYPPAEPRRSLDTCYDFTNYEEIQIPTISFLFGGNNMVDIHETGILFGPPSQACLAFNSNSNEDGVTIFGNVQQKTMQVVYDVAGGNLGFGTNGCA